MVQGNIQVVSRAWKEVDVSTIVKCLDRCGFDKLKDTGQSGDVEESDEDDDIPLALLVDPRRSMEGT